MLICYTGCEGNGGHTRTIQQHYNFLLDNLNADCLLLGRLYQSEVLSIEELETINSEKVSSRQNEKLLSMLSSKTKDQFDKFLDALYDGHQEFICHHITGSNGKSVDEIVYSRQLVCFQ